jgi:hypothetical protein
MVKVCSASMGRHVQHRKVGQNPAVRHLRSSKPRRIDPHREPGCPSAPGDHSHGATSLPSCPSGDGSGAGCSPHEETDGRAASGAVRGARHGWRAAITDFSRRTRGSATRGLPPTHRQRQPGSTTGTSTHPSPIRIAIDCESNVTCQCHAVGRRPP